MSASGQPPTSSLPSLSSSSSSSSPSSVSLSTQGPKTLFQPLVSLRAFKRAMLLFNEKMAQTACPELESISKDSPADLTVDDLRVPEPFEIIEEAIKREIPKFNHLLAGPAPKPKPKSRKRTRSKSEQNYIRRQAALALSTRPTPPSASIIRNSRAAVTKNHCTSSTTSLPSTFSSSTISSSSTSSSSASSASTSSSSSSSSSSSTTLPASTATSSSTSSASSSSSSSLSPLTPPPLQQSTRKVALASQHKAVEVLNFSDIPLYSDLLKSRNEALHCLREKSKRVKDPNSRRTRNYATRGLLAQAVPSPRQQEEEESRCEEATSTFSSLASLRSKHSASKNNSNSCITGDEILLEVSIQHPTNTHQKLQTFHVLSTQRLTELRDKFYCLQDVIFDGPELQVSSYFFIENTFYEDRRSELSIAYSQYLIPWLNKAKGGIVEHTSKNMQDTKFEDLTLKLNTPYLFCHQGVCRHLIYFSEVRQLTAADQPNRTSYPLLTFQGKTRLRKCRVCQVFPAKYVTYFNKLTPESPCFFCEDCYRAFHYTKEGHIIRDDYEVYPYAHE